jgi:hypothetical protein
VSRSCRTCASNSVAAPRAGWSGCPPLPQVGFPRLPGIARGEGQHDTPPADSPRSDCFSSLAVTLVARGWRTLTFGTLASWYAAQAQPRSFKSVSRLNALQFRYAACGVNRHALHQARDYLGLAISSQFLWRKICIFAGVHKSAYGGVDWAWKRITECRWKLWGGS